MLKINNLTLTVNDDDTLTIDTYHKRPFTLSESQVQIVVDELNEFIENEMRFKNIEVEDENEKVHNINLFPKITGFMGYSLSPKETMIVFDWLVENYGV